MAVLLISLPSTPARPLGGQHGRAELRAEEATGHMLSCFRCQVGLPCGTDEHQDFFFFNNDWQSGSMHSSCFENICPHYHEYYDQSGARAIASRGHLDADQVDVTGLKLIDEAVNAGN